MTTTALLQLSNGFLRASMVRYSKKGRGAPGLPRPEDEQFLFRMIPGHPLFDACEMEEFVRCEIVLMKMYIMIKLEGARRVGSLIRTTNIKQQSYFGHEHT